MNAVSLYYLKRVFFWWCIGLSVAWAYDWNGYVETNPQWVHPLETDSYVFHGLQNRINARFPMVWNGWLEVSNRTLIYTGPEKWISPDVAKQMSEDSGWVDATWAWSSTKYHSLLYTTWDRLFWEWQMASSVIRVGRQRVNWGVSGVWNPNDWFHASDYLDFSYTEKKGVDALRWQWFPGEVSFYYEPQSYDRGRLIQYVGTMGFDHMFSNSLYVNVSGLYNGYSLNSEGSLMTSPGGVSSQTLISKETALFWEWSYPLIPWVSVKWGALQSPQDLSFCMIPGLEVSYFENVDWTSYGMVCHGGDSDLYGGKGTVIILSLRAYY